jgi:hypothetical protein
MSFFERFSGDNNTDINNSFYVEKKVGRVVFMSAEEEQNIVNISPPPVKPDPQPPADTADTTAYLALSDLKNKEILSLSEHMFKLRNTARTTSP